MQHPENIRKVLKKANLSEGADLDAEQLERAKLVAATPDHKVAGPALATFVMHGKAAGDRRGRGGRVVGKMSMNEAAKKILGRAKGPLHAHEVAKRAISQKLVETKGKTPEQTMAARLAVGTRKGEFKRTAPNTYTLPDKKSTAKKATKKGPKEPAPAAA